MEQTPKKSIKEIDKIDFTKLNLEELNLSEYHSIINKSKDAEALFNDFFNSELVEKIHLSYENDAQKLISFLSPIYGKYMDNKGNNYLPFVYAIIIAMVKFPKKSSYIDGAFKNVKSYTIKWARELSDIYDKYDSSFDI